MYAVSASVPEALKQAIETFTKTRMDTLVLGNHVVRRGD